MVAKLSVCMATRNGSRYVRAQLESILAQLGPDDELVVSDDGSTDDTCDVVSSFADARILLLAGNSFRSPVLNFENALRNSGGEIIVLSDQDDIWLPGRLGIIRRHLGDKTAQVALIMMDGEMIDDGGNSLDKTIFAANRVGPGMMKNIYDNTYTGCCLAFTRPLLQLALPFPARIPMHDMWLGLLAELFGQVEFIPVRTICYRRHAANTSFVHAGVHEQIARRVILSFNLCKRYIDVTCFGHGRL